MTLKSGDYVEIRSKEEILRSLDKNGRLEALPFMPQMFQYCGQRHQVYKRAHKTCDTVNWTGGRKLPHTVHLEVRCDGQAYGGCQAGCLIFWKEAWLKPVAPAGSSLLNQSPPIDRVDDKECCTEEDVRRGTRAESQEQGTEITYACQATALPDFTTPLHWWDVRQYAEDYTSGNASAGRLFRGFVYVGYYYLTQAWRKRLGKLPQWVYDRFQALWGGVPFPRRRGTISAGHDAPACTLDLQPGELVRVRSHAEILSTIDEEFKNRGLAFDAELVPFCGRVYRVKTRVTKFIDEKKGVMKLLKTPAVILEGVWCNSRYSDRRMFCPRSIYSWWREIWLERIPDDG
jgi:hypothetical protein